MYLCVMNHLYLPRQHINSRLLATYLINLNKLYMVLTFSTVIILTKLRMQDIFFLNSKYMYYKVDINSHLFCTFISENQGLEKLRSFSNLRKISGPAPLNFFSVHLNFFSVCHLDLYHKPQKKLGDKLKWPSVNLSKRLRKTFDF